ncbi:TPA: hypothetical protein DCR49_08700 [Candidatus Delongbacteria bacterium]|nr:MAG: hypothetical protein A2Y39_01105 [Candidatus Delongbacteria bacterium GWF2_40_14]HAQ62053.1 hypothetical protein [Candidatus Delongbacteria bacterium]
MTALLLILTIPLYYVFKGIIVKETKALTIITLIIFALNILIVYYMNYNWFKIAVMVYLTYTFADYLCLIFLKRVIIEIPLMSRVSIISEEAVINYSLFRPVILIPLNIFLFFKKYPRIGLNDQIGVNVKSKDGTKINIKL